MPIWGYSAIFTRTARLRRASRHQHRSPARLLVCCAASPSPPMPAAKSISSDSQHHPTCPERSHPTCSADPIPSAPGTSQPCLVTPSPHRPLSRSQSAVPLIFWADASHIQPRLFPSSPPEALSRSPFSPPPSSSGRFCSFWPPFLTPVRSSGRFFLRIVWQNVCEGKLTTQ